MNEFNNSAGENAQKLEEIRLQRRNEALGKNDDEKVVDPVVEPKKDEKPLDNDVKNDYINDDSQVDPEVEKLQEFLENSFGNDALKLAKSYKSSQSEYTKLRNQYSEAEKILQRYEEIVEKSPTLKRAMDNAKSVEEIENLLISQKELTSKPVNTKPESKLDAPEKVEVSELIERGYLDGDFYNTLSESEKNAVVRRAELKYMEQELPKIISERTVIETQRRIEEMEKQKRATQQKEHNDTVNMQRYEKGIQSVVERFGLDFAGNQEDNALLEDIERTAAYIRDPQNPDLIDEEAIQMATEKVLRRTARFDEQVAKRNEEVAKVEGDRFNVNRRQERPRTEPLTPAERLRQRRIEQFEDMSRGLPHRKNDVLKL